MAKQISASQKAQVRLAVLAVGVIMLHTTVTVLEEQLFSLEAFTQVAGGAFMTLYMYFGAIVVYLPPALRSRKPRSASASRAAIAQVSTLYVGTTTLTKTSLRYIDMPTQTVLKSAKLLPVMAGSIIILGKRYTRREWMAACMLCAGIAIFNSATHFPAPQQTVAGAICIAVALACDALLGNYQKKVLSSSVTVPELMLYQSSAGFVYMLVITFSDGTLMPGVHLLIDDPAVSFTLFAWFVAITSGTALVLKLVDEYSAVTAIVVTTIRKALTLFASFIFFPKHFGIGHPIGAALVFGSAFIAMGKKRKLPDTRSNRDEGLPLLAPSVGAGGRL